MVGGHKQALGITIKEEVYEKFYTQLQEDISRVPDHILNPPPEITGFIPLNKISTDFFDVQFKFEPFGHRFKKPLYQTRGVLKSARLVGKLKNHLTCVITDSKGLIKFKGMQFFTTDVPEIGREYIFDFNLDMDTFGGGKNVQLMVKNLEIAKDL